MSLGRYIVDEFYHEKAKTTSEGGFGFCKLSVQFPEQRIGEGQRLLSNPP